LTSSSEELDIGLLLVVGNGDGVLMTDLGVELRDDEFWDDDRLDRLNGRRTGDDIELGDESGDTGLGGSDMSPSI